LAQEREEELSFGEGLCACSSEERESGARCAALAIP
jgi:hypothetical protein